MLLLIIFKNSNVSVLAEELWTENEKCDKHYFLLPQKRLSEKEMEIYEETLNIKFLQYSPADNHKELTDSLCVLNQQVELKREDLASNQSW